MYEHPYLSHQITAFETEQMVRAAERERFIAEHADQIVERPAGFLRRALRRARSADPAGASPLTDAAGRRRTDAGSVPCCTAPAG